MEGRYHCPAFSLGSGFGLFCTFQTGRFARSEQFQQLTVSLAMSPTRALRYESILSRGRNESFPPPLFRYFSEKGQPQAINLYLRKTHTAQTSCLGLVPWH
jgi:hypothetical protein